MKIKNTRWKKLTLASLATAMMIMPISASALSLGDLFGLLDGLDEDGENGTGGKNFDSITPLGTEASEGSFSVLSWNITGKPSSIGGISGSEAKQVGTLIQDWSFDIVGLQEVWVKNKREKVSSKLTNSRYKGRSVMWKGGDNEWGDGLWTIAKYPLDKDNYKRKVYNKCAGGPNHVNSIVDLGNIIDLANTNSDSESPDCLAEKGFSMSPITLADNLVVHVYNTHMNTKSNHNDKTIQGIKESQLNELAEKINSWSANYPVVLMGDFNLPLESGNVDNAWMTALMDNFAKDAGLTWACKDLQDQADADGTSTELPCSKGVDFIAYRSNLDFTLSASRWWRVDDGKVDNTHNAVVAVIDYAPTEADASIPSSYNFAAGNFELLAGDNLVSQNRSLSMQSDGNLVMSNSFGSALWSSGTNSGSDYRVTFQGDGNLVIYDGTGSAKWSSGTSGEGANLNLQSDGNLVIYNSSGSAVWASGSN